MIQPFIKSRTIGYIGQKSGRLKIVEILPRDLYRHIRVRCICDCGNEKICLYANFKMNKTQSCGCLFKEAMKKKRISSEILKKRRKERLISREKMVGLRFNRLTVISTTNRIDTLKCKCDCGKEKSINISNLKSGHTKSCGCGKIYRHPPEIVGLRLLFYRYRFRSKQRHNEELPLSLEMFKRLTSSNCYYCGSEPSLISKNRSKNSQYLYNGLDRVDTKKGYSIDNVVPCCVMCNRMKLDWDVAEFFNQVRRIHLYKVKKDGSSI